MSTVHCNNVAVRVKEREEKERKTVLYQHQPPPPQQNQTISGADERGAERRRENGDALNSKKKKETAAAKIDAPKSDKSEKCACGRTTHSLSQSVSVQCLFVSPNRFPV